MYYGTAGTNLREIAYLVCECLGHGANDSAFFLLMETAGAETHRGEIKDNTVGAGMGLTQFDEMPFYDVINRASQKDKQRLIDCFDLDIELVKWQDLRYNPFLSMVFTRLKYKKIPDIIPNTFEGRAKYWKEFYNTYAGKGTLDHYITSNQYQHEADIKFFEFQKGDIINV